MYYTFAGFGAVAGILLLLVFAILQWLHVPLAVLLIG
jgi:hypothetical protein